MTKHEGHPQYRELGAYTAPAAPVQGEDAHNPGAALAEPLIVAADLDSGGARPNRELDSPDRGQELSAAYQRIDELETRIKRLEADLHECREYLEDAVDVVDGDYGEPHPNRAMQLVTMIDETLAANFFEPFPAESGA